MDDRQKETALICVALIGIWVFYGAALVWLVGT